MRQRLRTRLDTISQWQAYALLALLAVPFFALAITGWIIAAIVYFFAALLTLSWID